MSGVEVHHHLCDDDRRAITELLARSEQELGRRALSDQGWLDFVDSHRSPLVAVVARDPDDGAVVAYGQASRVHGSWSMELVGADLADGSQPTDHRVSGVELVSTLVGAVARAGGGRLRWWAGDARLGAAQIAEATGFVPERTLLQMRVGLPVVEPGGAAVVDTRPFRPGSDEHAWLEVNNAAFHWHPEQGGWDLERLQRRVAEPWFDADGFLLHERDHRLAAFCWTKIHHDSEPPIGEIYVIAVHPDFHGLGLGRAMTVAGLAHIASRGVTTGMLYVDASNEPAVALYRDLGFTVHAVDQAFVIDIAPPPSEADTARQTETITGDPR